MKTEYSRTQIRNGMIKKRSVSLAGWFLPRQVSGPTMMVRDGIIDVNR
ncbi:MAG: hypothetical protein MK110_18330 [Fuerstiella sp.]|nr:hypothetical protein [Fuerstiella sp.]